MATKRLTREEKKERIRSSLIEAAADLFGERGYWGVSLDDIADRAGLTKGAVYSNFESKEDLLLEVAARQAVDLDPAIFEDRSIPLDDLLRRVGEEVGRLATSEEVRRIAPRELELSTLALTSEKIRDVVVAVGRRQREAIAALLSERAQEQGVELALPADELAAIFSALRTGLMGQRFIDPTSIPEKYFADAFAMVVAAASPRRKERKPRRPG